jgi:hypothetical protein
MKECVKGRESKKAREYERLCVRVRKHNRVKVERERN